MGRRTSGPKSGRRFAPKKMSKAGRKILAGLEEAAAHMRGEHVPGLVVHKPPGCAGDTLPVVLG